MIAQLRGLVPTTHNVWTWLRPCGEFQDRHVEADESFSNDVWPLLSWLTVDDPANDWFMRPS